jgi:hypothetical protein
VQPPPFPFRYYATRPDGAPEILYRLRFHAAVDPEVLASLCADVPGVPGNVHDRPADFFEAIAAAAEEPGRVEACAYGEWAFVYQHLGDPCADHPEEDAWFRDAFLRLHQRAALVEVTAVYGTLFDFDPDPWTKWSIAQQPPDPAPAIPGAPVDTPYDAIDAGFARR